LQLSLFFSSQYSQEMIEGCSSSSADKNTKLKCILCVNNERDILLKPCKHVIYCGECALTVDECSLCREDIAERVKLDKCLGCKQRPSEVMNKPCQHLNTCVECSKDLSTCLECSSQIDGLIGIESLAKLDLDLSENSLGQEHEPESKNLIFKLNQLNSVKEKVRVRIVGLFFIYNSS
jgi:hypothetical protein